MALHDMLSVSAIGCENEALKEKKTSKALLSASIMKYVSDQKYHIYPPPPIDCRVRINHEPDGLLDGDIQS